MRYAALVFALLGMTGPAVADYPVKPVRFVLGFAAGGAADLLCRYWGQKLTAVACRNRS